MNRIRSLVLLGVLAAALVLAFALQDVIRQTVILPIAYLWWVLGLYYHAFPQIVLWITLVVLVLLMLFGSLSTGEIRHRRAIKRTRPHHGPVEALAISLQKSRRGVYNKWLIAHRLGKLASDLLVQRGDRASSRVVEPLTGREWSPTEPVGGYLEAGLNGSFADYPSPSWPFRRAQPTPLDLEVEEAVEFLEVQMETDGRH